MGKILAASEKHSLKRFTSAMDLAISGSTLRFHLTNTGITN